MAIQILGICGGSCSGKTTLAKQVFNKLGPLKSRLIFQDNFYFDQSSRFDRDGGEINFDHPHAVDFELMAKLLSKLKAGYSIELPQYDFTTHKRKAETVPVSRINAEDGIIIVDGIHILSQKTVRDLLDNSVFLEIPESVRFDRRKNRDTKERGRTLEGVIAQFNNHVKPMHDQFVEPSKKWAKHILRNQNEIDSFIESIS